MHSTSNHHLDAGEHLDTSVRIITDVSDRGPYAELKIGTATFFIHDPFDLAALRGTVHAGECELREAQHAADTGDAGRFATLAERGGK